MRNVLTVFIASPSDLAPERKRAFEVVNEVNEYVKKLDWSIDLLGWEDTLPGYGRPQALINREVERCDLFIGLLWRRWGTPPARHLKFSSGFEEEFSIARTRRERTLSPEIWIFFKKVESAQIADAGAQLQSVIDFRGYLTAGKTIFFKEFDDVDAWERLLRRCLIDHVLGIAGTQGGSPEGPSGRTAALTKNASGEVHTSFAPAAGHQLATIANFLTPAAKTGNLLDLIEALDNNQDLEFLAVRTLLLSAALVAASESSDTPLPTHELNTLYRYRDRLQATDDELFVLFRTLLADVSEVTPGWYWFRKDEVGAIADRLLTIAWLDANTTVRTRSFDIMRQAHIRIHPRLAGVLPGIPSNIQDAAWAYLVDVATPEDVKLIRGSAKGSWLESRVEWLHNWTETSRNLDDFLCKVPDPLLITESMKYLILASMPQLAVASLEALGSMPRPDLSEAAIAELRTRGTAITETVLMSDSRQGRTLSWLHRLTPHGGPASETKETDEERYERLSCESTDSLKSSMGWYKVDGSISYRLLIERGEIARDVVRKDLVDKFQRIRNDSHQEVVRNLGTEAAETVRQGFEDLCDYVTERYTAGALAALATEATTEDVSVARRFLSDDRVRAVALRIVASKGTAGDVNDLMEIARSSSGYERNLALEGIQRLTADRLGTAKALIASEGFEMWRAALMLVSGLDDTDALQFLEELLTNENGDIRVSAVGLLRKRLDNKSLIGLLHKYSNRDTYFYNVVTWLDRMIYAPEPIHSYYEIVLKRKLEVLES